MDKVLIVDDSVMLLNYLEDSFIIYENEFKLLTAKDGLKAIDIIKKTPISLLVTDLQMPKMDGITLLAYVNKYNPSTPCIVMSGHGTPKIKEALQPDILQFIEKPFMAKELAQVIDLSLKRNFPDGSLSGISTVSFLQMVEMEEKTCLCEINSPDNPKGFFYFKGGILRNAFYDNLKGEKAALEMIQIENATISFRKPPDRIIPTLITKELTSLILEAMKLKDES